MNMQEPSSRWLVGMVLAILVLIVLSVAVTLFNRQEAELLPEDTPEGVVQRYLMALKEGDARTAYRYMSSQLQATCDYRPNLSPIRPEVTKDMVFVLGGTSELDAGQVQVRVDITQGQGSPPFGMSTYSYPVWFVLEREDEAWRFSDYPWNHYYFCSVDRLLVPAVPSPTPTPVPSTPTPGT